MNGFPAVPFHTSSHAFELHFDPEALAVSANPNNPTEMAPHATSSRAATVRSRVQERGRGTDTIDLRKREFGKIVTLLTEITTAPTAQGLVLATAAVSGLPKAGRLTDHPDRSN
jgi:hypothetical protein